MKVLHILHELKFSGAEIMYVDAAPEFMGLGCELSVLAKAENLGEYAPYFEKAGYKVFHRPFPSKKSLLAKVRYYRQIYQFLMLNNFDLMHIHASGAMFGMSFIAKLCGIKAYYTFHNVFPTRFYSYPWHVFQRWCAKNVFHCTFQTISHSVCNNERKVFFNRTQLIFNWFSFRRFYPATPAEKMNARQSLQIPAGSLVLISIGGCSHIKQHSEIILALPKLILRYPDLLYVHLGEGETEAAERELAKQLGVEKNIRFCGNITDVRKHLIISDMYLMPSKFEGISLTTIEAMACKIPCILYDVPGLSDFNKEGNNALLIQPGIENIISSVVRLAENTRFAVELTDHANKFVHTNFSLERNVSSVFKLYKS